jgi:regulator of sigma E protease
VKVQRGDKELPPTELQAVSDDAWPREQRGWQLSGELAWRLQKADSLGQALGMGLQRTQRTIRSIYLQLYSMITNRVSATKNLQGPLRIGQVAYFFAGMDVQMFVLFLGMISVNLAVINFLPIPVLDGGHMVFLVYEKLRGRPPSEAVRLAATYVGLALVLSLMLFVISLDVKRIFFD